MNWTEYFIFVSSLVVSPSFGNPCIAWCVCVLNVASIPKEFCGFEESEVLKCAQLE